MWGIYSEEGLAEGGFFSREEALDYMFREYGPAGFYVSKQIRRTDHLRRTDP